MNLLSTLKTNWRDLFAGIVIIIFCSFAADIIERWTLVDSGQTWLTNTVMVFRGLARFGAANLAAFFVFSFAWPTLNRYSNENFASTWTKLSDLSKFITLIAVCITYILAASICFAA
jgi:hypothetical protein